MTTESRWSIEELLVRYDLEPELRDVFVEGTFDREIFSHAQGSVDPPVTFYEIDSVDVPDDMLGRHGLSRGNKQRVIALARELSSLSERAKVVCLVDRDLDHWFGDLEVARHLRWTTFCCTESHFLTLETVRDIFVTTARTKIKSLETFFRSLTETLILLYALRLADRELDLSLSWVALKKYLKRNGDCLRFEVEAYATAVLNGNAQLARRKEFVTCYQRWIKRLDCDVRLSARGHDYTEVLAHSVGVFGGQREFASSGAIERLFVLLARAVDTISLELR